jgi:hypothetical protein
LEEAEVGQVQVVEVGLEVHPYLAGVVEVVGKFRLLVLLEKQGEIMEVVVAEVLVMDQVLIQVVVAQAA